MTSNLFRSRNTNTRVIGKNFHNLQSMALVRSLLYLFTIFILLSSIAALVLHILVRIHGTGDARLDNTVHGFGIAAAAYSLAISVLSLLVLLTKNLHRRSLNVGHLFLQSLAITLLGIISGIWILYHNQVKGQLKGIDHWSFAWDMITLALWLILLPLWVWKTMEEYALGHK